METIFKILRKIALIIGVSAFSACTDSELPMELGLDTFHYGYIDQGDKFGVEIGATREQAAQALRARSSVSLDEISCSYRLSYLIGCEQDAPLVHQQYRVKWFLRDGSIFLIYDGKRVTYIVCEFGWFASI